MSHVCKIINNAHNFGLYRSTSSLYSDKYNIFGRQKHTTPNNLKGKSISSQNWLIRQMKDPYVDKAKMMNYRCRSAFKLIEIDDKFCIFKPGQIVIDCGAAPGSWSQVAISKVNSKNDDDTQPAGLVVAIDKLQIYPIDGAIIFGNSDFTSKEVQQKLVAILQGKSIDIVISDMAPQASGIKSLDQENIIKLCYSAFRFAVTLSSTGASLLMKLWQGAGANQLQTDLERFYKNVRIVKPNASRSDSAEMFLLAREFKGLKK